MAWIKRVALPHVCTMPFTLLGFGEGSVWQCDECGAGWIWRTDKRGSGWNPVTITGQMPKHLEEEQ